MTNLDILMFLGPVSFFILLAWEAWNPARALPAAPGFRSVGVLCLLVMLWIGTYLPLLVPERWVSEYRLFDLSGLDTFSGFVVGWLVYTFLGFVWHRAVHASPLLWRVFHQLHHAPTRLDVASSTIFHPTETAAYTALAFVTTVFVLGLSPEAAAWVGTCAAFVSFFQHANIATPRWLGYVIQRPESHSLHHHIAGPQGNFSDFPLWDLLFGSFVNPRYFTQHVGFPGHASKQVLSMLIFRDVQGGGASPGLAQDGKALVAPLRAR